MEKKLNKLEQQLVEAHAVEHRRVDVDEKHYKEHLAQCVERRKFADAELCKGATIAFRAAGLIAADEEVTGVKWGADDLAESVTVEKMKIEPAKPAKAESVTLTSKDVGTLDAGAHATKDSGRHKSASKDSGRHKL